MSDRKAPSPEEGHQTAPAVRTLAPMSPDDAARVTCRLLEECRAFIMRYFVMKEEQAVIMAAWVPHTHVFEAADITPYLHITAPEKECGKSNLMDLLAAVAAKPVQSSGTTAAALVRTVHAMKPTIFIDEMDALLGGSRDSAESIRGILNAGYRRGGVFRKCNATTHDVEEFNAFCPKCLTGIGELWDTVASRSIAIEMRRKRRDEVVEQFRQRTVREAGHPIRTELEAWAARGASAWLQTMRPAPIATLSDRQNDISEILLSIGQLAGSGWHQWLATALQTVFNAARGEDSSVGAVLLFDIRAVFNERKKSGGSVGISGGLPSQDRGSRMGRRQQRERTDR